MSCLGRSSRYKVFGTLAGSIAAHWGYRRGTADRRAGARYRGARWDDDARYCLLARWADLYEYRGLLRAKREYRYSSNIDSRLLTACRLQARFSRSPSRLVIHLGRPKTEMQHAARSTRDSFFFLLFGPSRCLSACMLSARPHGQIRSRQISSAGRTSRQCLLLVAVQSTATLALHFFDPPTAVASQLVREQ